MSGALFVILISFFGIFYLIDTFVFLKKEKLTHFTHSNGLKLRWLPFTLLGSQLGAGLLLGLGDEAARSGWQILVYPAGSIAGFLMLTFGVGRQFGSIKSKTIGELLENFYQCATLRKISSCLIISAFFGILIAISVAINELMLPFGWNPYLVCPIFWAILLAYVALGGFRAVVRMDIIQTIIILLLLTGVTVSVFLYVPTELIVQKKALQPLQKSLSFLIIPPLFLMIGQDAHQRLYAIKEKRSLRKIGLYTSLLLAFLAVQMVMLGIVAGNQDLGSRAAVIQTAIAYAPYPLPTLFMTAILLVLFSTGISVLCTITSSIQSDFKNLKISPQLITIILGAFAVFSSFYFSRVVPVVIGSYTLVVLTLFVPIIAPLFLKQLSPKAPYFSILGGALGFLLPFGEIIALLLSVTGYYVCHVLSTKQPNPLRNQYA